MSYKLYKSYKIESHKISVIKFNLMLRKEHKVKWSSQNDLEFQVIDWTDLDATESDDSETETETDSEEEETNNYNNQDKYKYTIRIFGVTKEGYSVCATVTGFKPYFYVAIPNNWKNSQVNLLLNTISDSMKYVKETPKFEIVRKHKFRGFTNNALDKYIKLSFNTVKTLQQYRSRLYEDITVLGVKRRFDMFESKMTPLLRFMHTNDLKASGWVRIPKKTYQTNGIYSKISKCQIDVVTKYQNVLPLDNETFAPMLIASFDIEADSSHGDFPLAKKTYQKLASEVIVHYWNIKSTIKKYKNIKNEKEFWTNEIKHRLEEEHYKVHKTKLKINPIDLNREVEDFIFKKSREVRQLTKLISDEDIYFFNLIISAFSNNPNDRIEGISYVYTKRNLKPLPKVIHKIIGDIKYICQCEPIKIKGNNELKIGVNEILNRMENCKEFSQLEYVINDVAKRRNLSVYNLRAKVLVKDVLTDYIDSIMTRTFPSVEGDRVIQIGTVVQKFGDPDICYKHIVTLNGCDPIEGVEVVACKTERQVLLEWAKFINRLDPDIMTGYNIFGFDEKFIYERACELGCDDQVSRIGRVIDEEPEYIQANLSSSALGDNTLDYIKTTGRVQFDLYKVVQRDYKLASYKLDFVANNFIRGDLKKILEPRKLEVSNSKDLNVGNFIYLTPKDSADQCLDGIKYKILEKPDNNTILVDKDVELPSNKKFCWGLAKDDVNHKDIFRLQKGSDADRRTVAIYCIQDCALLIYLLNKLCVLTNNLAMASVCSVPFSYIFLRGQGIKLFSLVGKECRLLNYLVPDLIKESELEKKRNRRNKRFQKYQKLMMDEDDGDDVFATSTDGDDLYHINYEDDTSQQGFVINDNESGYEGAIVIRPKPDIYFEPVSVTDYGSLYPSSMISENLSHDSIVFDAKYDNLPGYDYLDVTYEIKKEIDKAGTKMTVGYKTCRFAQFPKGEKGIIPRILMKLLASRKATKKRMASEKDEFKKAILDGLQLAFKLTANSLYGQIGATTSSIYLKDIAASTTATGRRLLLFARSFAEKNIEGCDCVYGDSIPGDEPILYQKKYGDKFKTTVADISYISSYVDDDWKPYRNFKPNDTSLTSKEQAIPSNMNVYVNDEWVKVKRLIRHKTNKKIFRVSTTCGSVDVTEDHSLINNFGNMIKPEECVPGETLAKESYPDCHLIDANYIGKTLTYNDKINASVAYSILKTQNNRIKVVNTTGDEFKLIVYDKDELDEPSNLIKSVKFLRYTAPDEYVYDIETECGWFTAGIGGITLKNTDSIFVKFHDKDGNKLEGKEGLQESINKGVEIEKSIQMYYKKPHKLEYEKTFYPFILFTKKRYVGHLYETDVNKYKQKSMGIVLKRRDNAPIVKKVFGDVINTIMNEKDIHKSVNFLRQTLNELLNGKVDVNQLIISKTLRGYYKDPDSIAHKVLADRMAERDPGNKPQTNDRIPYVYIDIPERPNMLQGDRIEHVDYVKENNLKPNYLFYLTNQIMKPVSQIYELIVTKLEGYNKNQDFYDNELKRQLSAFEGNMKKALEKVSKMKKKEVQHLIFDDIIGQYLNKKEGYQDITQMLGVTSHKNKSTISTSSDIKITDDFKIENTMKPRKRRKNFTDISSALDNDVEINNRLNNIKSDKVKVTKMGDITKFFS